MLWLRSQQPGLLLAYCRRRNRRKTEAPDLCRMDVSLQSHPPHLEASTCSKCRVSWRVRYQNRMSLQASRHEQSTNQISATIFRWRQSEWFMCSTFSSDPDPDWIWQGPSRGQGTMCPCWELTHQGSRNMVPMLNPIRTHIIMKTGRLLGTQAIVVTAGMKSWERQNERLNTLIFFYIFTVRGFLTDSPMKTVTFFPILRRTICHRGTAMEADACENIETVSFEIQKLSWKIYKQTLARELLTALNAL